ncbi:hypothetical protein C4N19_01070 [Fusobacterium mortiferum ATCC 9817]|uniref:Uncharacterized protein n=2 Tax=Fusobacterium mortiferum TaxID=850 RepID=A0ABM6TT18_FUSMR|nr:hypothetical protein C4N19_01070 [Fusobacterium mortiferum ATCC 9817]
MGIMYFNSNNNGLNNILLLNELYKLKEAIELQKKLDEINFEIEKEIVEIAISFSKGEYKKWNYISPFEAYLLSVNYVNEINTTLEELEINIKKEINKIVKYKVYDIEILDGFIGKFIEYLINDKEIFKGIEFYGKI